MIRDKEWGKDVLIFHNHSTEIHRIEIKKGGVSTFGRMHRHRHKYNRLYVEKGCLKVYIQTATEIKEHLLGEKLQFRKVDVYPGVRHRFEAIEATIAYEIYWVYCNPEDILRD